MKETSGGWFNLGVSVPFFSVSVLLFCIGLRREAGVRIPPQCVRGRCFGARAEEAEDQPAAIDAWNKSIALSPSADAYTSASK